MTRERLALLLMLAMLAVSAWNIVTVSTLSEKISAQLEQSEIAAHTNDWDKAALHFEKALELWLNAEQYCHIFIRHPETDSCSDVFCDLEQAILAKSSNDIEALFHKLHYHIEGIAEMEKVRLGNIL